MSHNCVAIIIKTDSQTPLARRSLPGLYRCYASDGGSWHGATPYCPGCLIHPAFALPGGACATAVLLSAVLRTRHNVLLACSTGNLSASVLPASPASSCTGVSPGTPPT